MPTDPLTTATAQIRDLTRRKLKPLSWLEATFAVSEQMSKGDAEQVLQALMGQRYLSRIDADLAQLLSQKLGIEVKWQHTALAGDGEWREGRGMI